MNWFTKPFDIFLIIMVFFISMNFINDKFNDLQKELASLKTEVTVVKEILVLIIELSREADLGEK